MPQSRGWWHERNRAYAEDGKNIPRRYAHATTDRVEIHEWVYAAVSDPDSAKSLLLAGPTGTGKTHAAFAALRLSAESCRPAAWRATSSAALLGDLRPSAGRDSEALPCLFATNFAPEELSGRLGDRTASRLAEMCQVLTVKGDDRRRQR
jgi:DNA replication protein DnaC